MSRILLLEDDLSLITGLSFAFRKHGFEADNARTLREADTLWADGKYDLLVLDVSLPDGSGFEFCQRVRRTSKVPIIFLTASDEETSIIMGLDIGGDDYITKPFKLGVLISRINALLRQASAFGAVWLLCFRYFKRQNRTMEQAVTQINAYLDGDRSARIECDSEGELYRMFHSVNSMAAVLNAHADNELREKEFLKNTISDISHQLKTPLAALNIYNGLMQDEDIDAGTVKEFAELSEQELDRIETLVQSLLKITRLGAGSIIFEKDTENVADMMHDIALHFAYRAKQEEKELTLAGAEDTSLFCDRDWLIEAIGNLVKNALDHTDKGGTVRIEWRALPSAVQLKVADNGCGIHPEDLHHIFKRFYRSRFSKDTQGVGLGLPLAKAIIEAHDGTIEVDSELGRGTRTAPALTR